PNPRPTEPPLPCVWQHNPSTKVSLPSVRTSVVSKLVSVPPKLSRRPPTNWPGYSTACSSTAPATSIKEKPSTKNVTVTGFCVTSSGGLPNSASNSLRLIQALTNRRLLESSDLELLGSSQVRLCLFDIAVADPFLAPNSSSISDLAPSPAT